VCVTTINNFRKTKGLPALERWTAAEGCSDGQSKDDGASNTGHGSFGRCGEWAQNECPGWPGPPDEMIPECLKAMWDQGPGEGHYDTMASTEWKAVACGFATTSKGSVWSVQNFK
jgi:hypothetical protein